MYDVLSYQCEDKLIIREQWLHFSVLVAVVELFIRLVYTVWKQKRNWVIRAMSFMTVVKYESNKTNSINQITE